MITRSSTFLFGLLLTAYSVWIIDSSFAFSIPPTHILSGPRNQNSLALKAEQDIEEVWNRIMWKIEDFERVMPKARYSDKAHAIQGTLMHDTMIEAYEVYQHKNLVIPSADGLEINLPVILAKVNFGTHLNGHGGFVHGGIMSLMFDDIMGWGCDRVLPENKTPVTANLNVDFRRPVPAGTKVRIQVVLERWEGRKLFWKARMLDARNTEEEILYAEATSLYIVLKDK